MLRRRIRDARPTEDTRNVLHNFFVSWDNHMRSANAWAIARDTSHALQGAKPLACNRKRWEPRSAFSPVDFPHYSARSQVTVTTISWPSRTARDRFTLYGGRIRSRHTR